MPRLRVFVVVGAWLGACATAGRASHDDGRPSTDAGIDHEESGAPTDAKVPAMQALDAGACAPPLTWSKVAGSPKGYQITGSGPSDIWIVADPYPDAGPSFSPCARDASTGRFCKGILLRGDGATWSLVTSLGDGSVPPVWVETLAVWVVGNDDAFVGVPTSEVFLWDGAQWTPYSLQDNRVLNFFWGSGPNDVWGTKDSLYLGHWDGNTWVHVDSVHGGPLAGGAPGDWWVAGDSFFPDAGLLPTVTHHLPSQGGCPPDAARVFAGPSEPYCCVDASGAPCGFFDAAVDLTRIECAAGPFDAIGGVINAAWASASDDVWFVGSRTFHFDGTSWTCMATPSTNQLHGVWGTSRRDVWAVGDAGTLLHFDGRTWSSVPSPTTGDLMSVWASGPCDVWAIGDAVYHAQPSAQPIDP
jgi:hypothetical protein